MTTCEACMGHVAPGKYCYACGRKGPPAKVHPGCVSCGHARSLHRPGCMATWGSGRLPQACPCDAFRDPTPLETP